MALHVLYRRVYELRVDLEGPAVAGSGGLEVVGRSRDPPVAEACAGARTGRRLPFVAGHESHDRAGERVCNVRTCSVPIMARIQRAN